MLSQLFIVCQQFRLKRLIFLFICALLRVPASGRTVILPLFNPGQNSGDALTT